MSAGPTPLPASAGLQIKRLSERATLPTRGSALAAGYDLYAAEPKLIPARSKALIDTQLSLAVPLGTYGRIAPRSGLASKFGIQTGAGVVDCDYRGVLFVLLFNHGGEDFQVNAGDRIAQLILEKIETPEIIEVQQLDATVRGEGGFGSTGGFAGLAGTATVVEKKAGEVAGLVGQGMDVVSQKTAEMVDTVKTQAPGVVKQVMEGVRGVGEALGGAGGAQAQVQAGQGQGQAK